MLSKQEEKTTDAVAERTDKGWSEFDELAYDLRFHIPQLSTVGAILCDYMRGADPGIQRKKDETDEHFALRQLKALSSKMGTVTRKAVILTKTQLYLGRTLDNHKVYAELQKHLLEAESRLQAKSTESAEETAEQTLTSPEE